MPDKVDWVKIDSLQKGVDMRGHFCHYFLIGGENCNLCKVRGWKVRLSLNKMPIYAKFMKEVLSKRKELPKGKSAVLTGSCREIFQG